MGRASLDRLPDPVCAERREDNRQADESGEDPGRGDTRAADVQSEAVVFADAFAGLLDTAGQPVEGIAGEWFREEARRPANRARR